MNCKVTENLGSPVAKVAKIAIIAKVAIIAKIATTATLPRKKITPSLHYRTTYPSLAS